MVAFFDQAAGHPGTTRLHQIAITIPRSESRCHVWVCDQSGGGGHAVLADPRARPGMTKSEIVDRLSWFKELGVTMSSVPIPTVQHIDAYFDYTQWVAEEIMPAVA